ncbi:MAG: leucine-rich repeat protein, partial [Bacilli bacterium]|nr:leucine-rich repeat protein [Bacilli bacterium]
IEITDSEMIPYWCFGRCVNLSSVTLTSIERIGAGAFINCESLTNIVLDSKLRLSDEQVFKGCNSIRKIYYRGSIDNWCGIEFVGLASTPFHKTALLYLEDAEGDTLFDDVHYTLTQSLILSDTLTNIGVYQFYGIKSITSVIIPANVALISDFAFGQMVDLTTVDFNAINTSLSSNSSPFSGCEGLSRIVFGDEVEQVPSYLFQNCGGVQEITFGTKVNTIGDGAFYGCAKLEQLILNDSLTTVGKDAFGGCSNLSKISFGPSLCAIGASAFYTASVAERSVYYRGDFASWCSIVFTNMYSIPFGRGGFLYLIAENGEETFDGAQYAQLTSIEIPQQTTQVGDYQFAKIYGVMTVTIGAHVTSVGEYAFAQCKDMTALIIDSELSKLGGGAFYGDVSLESINTKTIGNPATDVDRISYLFGGTPPQTLTHYEIGAGVIDKLTFQDCNIISLTIYGTTVIGDGSFTYAKIQELSIGENVTSIGDQAFMNCAQLTSVTLGQSLTNIGVSAFANCISLTSVTTPYSLKVLGDYTFEGCSNITEVVLRGDDLNIGAFAFSYNSKLGKVTLGSGVRSLARQVFWYANSIAEVYFEGDLSAWANLYFEDEHAQPCHFGAKLYFNGQRVADIVIPESVTKLNDWAFYGVQGLRNLHFGPTLKEFGYTTFRDIVFENIYYSDSYATYGQLFEGVFPQGHYLYCNDSLITEVTITSNRFSFSYNLGIVHVDIDTNLTMLADQFVGCANLKTIRLPNTLKSFVATNAFGDCTSLESIVIPESCTQLGNGLFKGCVSLASVTLPSSSTYLSEGMFEGCASLKQIELPATLTSISPRAFAQCTALTSIVIPQGVTEIGDSAFYGCSSLASVQLPSSLSAIDSSAFESCAAIVTINLPESLETLGFRAFCNCSSLAAISIPAKVTNLSWTFFNCTALCDVTLNDNISWMDGTFSGCT